MFQAMVESSCPSSISSRISSSNAPVLTMSATMIGLDVAPVAPSARFFCTSLGSIESSQTLVPVPISERRDIGERVLSGSYGAKCTVAHCRARRDRSDKELYRDMDVYSAPARSRLRLSIGGS